MKRIRPPQKEWILDSFFTKTHRHLQAREWMDIVGRGGPKNYMSPPDCENRLQAAQFCFVWLKAQGLRGVLRGSFEKELQMSHIPPLLLPQGWLNKCLFPLQPQVWSSRCYDATLVDLTTPYRYLGDRKPSYVTEL